MLNLQAKRILGFSARLAALLLLDDIIPYDIFDSPAADSSPDYQATIEESSNHQVKVTQDWKDV